MKHLERIRETFKHAFDKARAQAVDHMPPKPSEKPVPKIDKLSLAKDLALGEDSIVHYSAGDRDHFDEKAAEIVSAALELPQIKDNHKAHRSYLSQRAWWVGDLNKPYSASDLFSEIEKLDLAALEAKKAAR